MVGEVEALVEPDRWSLAVRGALSAGVRPRQSVRAWTNRRTASATSVLVMWLCRRSVGAS